MSREDIERWKLIREADELEHKRRRDTASDEVSAYHYWHKPDSRLVMETDADISENLRTILTSCGYRESTQGKKIRTPKEQIPDYDWVQYVPRFRVEEGGKVVPDGHNPDGSLKYKLYKAKLIGYIKLDGRDFYGIPKEQGKEVISNGTKDREPDTAGHIDKKNRGRRLGNLSIHNLRVAKTRVALSKTGR